MLRRNDGVVGVRAGLMNALETDDVAHKRKRTTPWYTRFALMTFMTVKRIIERKLCLEEIPLSYLVNSRDYDVLSSRCCW